MSKKKRRIILEYTEEGVSVDAEMKEISVKEFGGAIAGLMELATRNGFTNEQIFLAYQYAGELSRWNEKESCEI